MFPAVAGFQNWRVCKPDFEKWAACRVDGRDFSVGSLKHEWHVDPRHCLVLFKTKRREPVIYNPIGIDNW